MWPLLTQGLMFRLTQSVHTLIQVLPERLNSSDRLLELFH